MPSYHSNISRLQSDIARLQKDDAALLSKESALLKKVNSARDAIGRTSSTMTISSKLKEIERASSDLATQGKKRAEISGKVASKTKELNDYIRKQATEDERSRKKVADEQKRLLREQETKTKQIGREIRRMAEASPPALSADRPFDFFISHASEDKADFVTALANELTALSAEVFYDQATLKIGDSLRRNIDAGLRNSRYGIVVLSSAFFSKEWPARELDGLTALEVGGQTRILPIWHKVSKDEVAAYSPVLADKVALNTSLLSVKEIAAELFGLL
ncbi:toll/interleukin-1 receptor domain-containing protein [Mesorhizobium sp. B3-1-3]|uniref:toll/interleukin-1 receptor domain-containing protein n=1 Tax=unclassified Mesorhizobium TaxID=325217 RepID=UPI00112BDBED|nr:MULTISPECIES: toll/interleukin-1 receptor domain-containing protein [unclassified Mesorhizobium]TPI60967.1 toll/interleukin-1 receptor domain-containing protein [Mesorhizobium sp. B3-1-3]TPI67962.1 toll/interleukin-1 receptor domain-containing protein [Mesorhizobium sp. B3-1-8]